MADSKEGEKRRYKRIQAKYSTQIRLTGSEAAKGWNILFLRNIGAGGVLFPYDQKLEPETVVDLIIHFPALPAPLKCQAKILRSQPDGKPAPFQVAALFMDISDEDRKAINDAAETFYINKLKIVE